MTPIILEEGNVNSLQTPLSAEMDKAVKHIEKDLLTVRTGKANVAMIQDIKVECYGGTIMNLRDVASLSAPDVNLLTIQPWDKGLMNDIERAINNSQLGLTPNTDDEMIRLELPRMSTERRDELAKVVGKKIEESKVAIRNIRKDAQNMIRDAQKAKNLSEDFATRLNKVLQDITDKYIEKIDTIGENKKSELKAV